MKGKIIIECDGTGAHITTHMKGVDQADQLFLVHSLGMSLELTPEEWMVLSLVTLDDKAPSPTMITVDLAAAKQQLEEEE